MKIRVYSDLHQELRDSSELFNISIGENEKEQILILAGDIDQIKNYKISIRKEWLEDLSKRFYKILYIFGNHEYYKGKIGENYILKNIEFCKDIKNLHILSRYNESIIIDNIKFIGATLWTNLKDIMFLDHNLINDVKSIKSVNNRGFTKFGSETWKYENEKDLEWIDKELQNTDLDVIVITHHAPILTNDPRDKVGKYMRHNCNELNDFILENKKIKYWVHGHVHQENALKRKIGETIIFSNTIGGKTLKDDITRSIIEF